MPRQKKRCHYHSHVEGDEDIGRSANMSGSIFDWRTALSTGISPRLAHLDMTQKQVSVLWLVDDHPESPRPGLARRMRMDRATTMTMCTAWSPRAI